MNQGTEEGILTSALVLTALFLSCHWGRGRRGRRERPTLFSLEPRSGQRRLGTGAAPAWEQRPREGRDAEGGADVPLSNSWPRPPGRTSGSVLCSLSGEGTGEHRESQGGLPTQHIWFLSLQSHLGHAFALRDTRHG